MTKEQFKAEIDNFLAWTSDRERPKSSWFLSLEEFAKMEFNRAYDEENPKPQKPGDAK